MQKLQYSFFPLLLHLRENNTNAEMSTLLPPHPQGIWSAPTLWLTFQRSRPSTAAAWRRDVSPASTSERTPSSETKLFLMHPSYTERLEKDKDVCKCLSAYCYPDTLDAICVVLLPQTPFSRILHGVILCSHGWAVFLLENWICQGFCDYLFIFPAYRYT